MITKREATKAGRRAGLAAASWKFDGNTTEATYRAFVKGNEEGDPAIMDAYAPPLWLSGEWAGESITEILGPQNARDYNRADSIADAYMEAAETAYWRELERVARYHV